MNKKLFTYATALLLLNSGPGYAMRGMHRSPDGDGGGSGLTEEQKKEKALELVTNQAKKAALEIYKEKAAEFAALGVKSDEAKALIKSIAEEVISNYEITEEDGKTTALKAILVEMQKQHDALSAKVNANRKSEQAQKSFAQIIGETLQEKSDDIAKFERKETKSLVIDFKAVGDMSTGNVTGGSRYGQVMANGIIMLPNRKVHMKDIIPGGNVGPGNTFTFMRENGQGEGAIAAVAEGATKSQFDLDLIEATVNIETIAGWLRVTRKAMNNIPGFISFLQNRLPEKFEKVKDSQFLYGSGTTPNIKGILATGNFVASTASGTAFLAEKITYDIAVLEDTYEREATAVLMRPLEIATFYRNKAAGSGEYDLPENVAFVNGQLYISGVPVYPTTALTSGDYVVGDFQNGAQILTQEAMRIEFFEQDGTNVRENKVTVRIEGNYALPVYGPDFFIKGSTVVA